MKVVLDTNVLVSATLSDGPPYEILRYCEENTITVITSPGIIEETHDVLNRDKIPFSENQVDEFIEKVMAISRVVSPEIDLTVVDDDPDDDKIIECAVSADADYLVSGDSHLLNLTEYQGIPIVSPDEFIEELS